MGIDTRERVRRRSRTGRKNLESLLFDPRNPRLPEEAQGSTQDELLALMARDYRIVEIGQSLADNGYFDEEPLVVMREAEGIDRFVVLEGNRRLAALKLIENPKASPRQASDWQALKDRALDRGHDLKNIPVVEYDDRDSVTAFLGFRHISGALKWEPLAKARFVHQLVHDRNMSFRDVAREIGSKSDWVRNQFLAYRIFLQARRWGMNVEGVESEFSVLGRALVAPSTREFIGVEHDGEAVPDEPVPLDKKDALAEILSWIFGDSERMPALRESRDLPKLGAVLKDEDATAELRANRDLEYAFLLAGGEVNDLLQTLRRARHNLDESLRSVHRHRGNPKVEELVESCFGSAKALARHFPGILADGDAE